MWNKMNKRLEFLKTSKKLLLIQVLPFLIFLSLFLLNTIIVGADPTSPPPPPKKP